LIWACGLIVLSPRGPEPKTKRKAQMPKFTITNPLSGVILGTYEAKAEKAALETLANDAGYASYEEMSELFGQVRLNVTQE